MLNHFITEQDSLQKKVRIFFTLVVVYDLTEDGSRLDEKNTKYCGTKYLISKLLLVLNSNSSSD
jgi:hypothetical protein